MTDSDEEHRALAPGMRREEPDDLLIEEGEAGSTEALGIRRQVHPSSSDTALQLSGAIATIAPRLQDQVQIGEAVDVDRGVSGQLLKQSESSRQVAEVSFTEQFERAGLPLVVVGTGRQSLHGVDDQVEIDERLVSAREEVGCKLATGPIEKGGKLLERDRGLAFEGPRRATAMDDGLYRLGRNLRVRQRLE